MTTADRAVRPDRLKAILAAVVVQLLLGYAVIAGLAIHMPAAVTEQIQQFAILPPPPPPPPEKQHVPPRPSHKPAGGSSPPNLRSKATEIVAPRPIVPPPVPPPPVTVALQPATGSDATTGAATIAGPGTGSGGRGNGTGSGDGDGDGDTPPVWRKGRLKDSDYPAAAGNAGAGGTVSVRYTVTTAGRATDCRVTRSSGNADLDSTTCRLIVERFRFDPSRDAQGQPVESILVEDHSWIVHDAPPTR